MSTFTNASDVSQLVLGCCAVSELMGTIEDELPRVIRPTSGRSGRSYTYVNGHGRLLLPLVLSGLVRGQGASLSSILLDELNVCFDDSHGDDVLQWTGPISGTPHRASSGKYAKLVLPPWAPPSWSNRKVFVGSEDVKRSHRHALEAAISLLTNPPRPSWSSIRALILDGMGALARLTHRHAVLENEIRSIRAQLMPTRLFDADDGSVRTEAQAIPFLADFFISCTNRRIAAWICATDQQQGFSAADITSDSGTSVRYFCNGKVLNVSPGGVFGAVYLDYLEDSMPELADMKAKGEKSKGEDGGTDMAGCRIRVVSLDAATRPGQRVSANLGSTIESMSTDWARTASADQEAFDLPKHIQIMLRALQVWDEQLHSSRSVVLPGASEMVSSAIKERSDLAPSQVLRALVDSIYPDVAIRLGSTPSVIARCYEIRQVDLMKTFASEIGRQLRRGRSPAEGREFTPAMAVDRAFAVAFGISQIGRVEPQVAYAALLKRVAVSSLESTPEILR